MNNYYGPPLSPDTMLSPTEMQRQMAQQQRAQQARQAAQGRDPAMINTSGPTTTDMHHAEPMSALSDISMTGGDSIDDIIRQNTNELHRRRSVSQHAFAGRNTEPETDPSLGMMDFGDGSGAFSDFHYADTFDGMSGNLNMSGHSDSFSPHDLMAMADHQPYGNMNSDMMGAMSFSDLNMDVLTADPSNLSMFNSPSMGTHYPVSNLDTTSPDFGMDMTVDNTPIGTTNAAATAAVDRDADEDMMTLEGNFDTPHRSQAISRFRPNLQVSMSQDAPGLLSPPTGTPRAVPPVHSGPSNAVGVVNGPMTPATNAPTPRETAPEGKSIYSKSGFDMLRALWYVASRKNQKLNIGAVDLSCAFVVCDVMLNDCPIIYVSDNFQNLTGYNRHEIVGKNCRFLQAPDGNVEAGSKREFVENHAVLNLKEAIARGEEIQQSLINYRKGGKPFLNLLTMIPIPWDSDDIRYFIGFQIDLVECPDAISGHNNNGALDVDYAKSDIGKYIWDPPNQSQWEPENGQTLGIDDVSTLLQQFNPKGVASDWHRQSWDKMLLENADDVVHVLSLKGMFLYLSPSCKKVLEYDPAELVGNTLSTICHPSDVVPVTRELKDASTGAEPVSVVYRILRKNSGYTWFESHGTMFSEQGKGRKCIILVGRKRPVFALRRHILEANGGIGDSEIWTKISTSGMFLFVSSSVRSLLDLVPDNLVGTSMQDLMRKESRPEFGRTIEKARMGKVVSCKHEVQNKRGQVLQAYSTFYPGDADEGQKPTFLLAQTKLIKASSRAMAQLGGVIKTGGSSSASLSPEDPTANTSDGNGGRSGSEGSLGPQAVSDPLPPGSQDAALAADDNIFDELKTTRCTSWQYELRQMEKVNRVLAEELAQLLSSKKKRKRRKGGGNMVRDCANCHTMNTPEWRRGPSGNRDLCNSCGLRWAKQTGKVSPRNSSRGNGSTRGGDAQSKKSASPIHSSPVHRGMAPDTPSLDPVTKAATTPTSAVDTDDFPVTPGGAAAAAAAAAKAAGHFNPPPSRPLLAGGSGAGGSGMEMTAIQEEREMSA